MSFFIYLFCFFLSLSLSTESSRVPYVGSCGTSVSTPFEALPRPCLEAVKSEVGKRGWINGVPAKCP